MQADLGKPRLCSPTYRHVHRDKGFSRGTPGIGLLVLREHVRTMHAMSIATWAVH